jgi:hypothetical protein
LVSKFQWEDWTDLRFSEITSEKYRRSVHKLATRLVEANRQVEQTLTVIAKQQTDEAPIVITQRQVELTPINVKKQEDEVKAESADDSPGILDRLAKSEDALPKLKETLEAMTQDILLVGQIMREGLADIERGNAQGKGFSARIIVARQIAAKLGEPIEHTWILSNQYVSQIHDIDEGFRIIIERASIEIKSNPDAKKNFCVLFSSIRNMQTQSHIAFENIKKMIEGSESLEKQSRDMRPSLRRLRQGLTVVIESETVMQEWIRLIDSTGFMCEE